MALTVLGSSGGGGGGVSIDGVTVTGTPSANQVLTATSATAAAWQNPTGSATQQVSPTGATYTAALGDRAAITPAATTSAVLPTASTAGTRDIFIQSMGGSGTCTVTATGGIQFVGANGTTSSVPMLNTDNYTFRVVVSSGTYYWAYS